jgi:hypothetical protein
MSFCRLIATVLVVLVVIAPRADAAGFLQGFRFEAGFVHASIQPEHFSDGMIGIGTDKLISGIEVVSGVEAGIGCGVSSRFGVSVRSGYTFGSKTTPIKFGFRSDGQWEFVDSELECRIADVPLTLALDYRATRDHWTAAIELAGEVHFIEVSERTPEIESYGVDAHKHVWGKEESLGAHAALTMEWAPVRRIFLDARVGYRVAETTQFKSFSVELGGWFFGLFIGLKPWT